MRFASRSCYQKRGSLLHCLFTLTRLAAGGTISVALSVTCWAMQNCKQNCSFQLVPGYYPAFFPKEPGLSLTSPDYHQSVLPRLYSICYLLTNCQRINLRPLLFLNHPDHRHHHQNLHYPDLLNPLSTRHPHPHQTQIPRALPHLRVQGLHP